MVQANSVELTRLINLVHVPEINREFNRLLDEFAKKYLQKHVQEYSARRDELLDLLYLSRPEQGTPSNFITAAAES